MASYPIWMDITSCIYKSSKGYGIKQEGKTNIYVGTGPRNSHHFGEIVITHRDHGKEGKSFRLYLDGTIIREVLVKDGELISQEDDFIVYDNGGESYDRFTVFGDYGMALALSDTPEHPLGFSQFSDAIRGDHLGRRIKFSSLSEKLQQHIIHRFHG